MGFWNKLFWRDSQVAQPITTEALGSVVQPLTIQEIIRPAGTPIQPIIDAPAATSPSRPQYAKLRRVTSPVLSFKMRTGVSSFEQPEYDMAESGRIEDVESYVARAFALKDGLMFKEGYSFVGKNPTTIEYIKKRFDQIAMVTGSPLYLLAKGIGEDLIRLRNAFVIKVRNAQASGGRVRQKLGSKGTLQPVAGYFTAPASTIFFKRDDYGRILKYEQSTPDGKSQEFNPDDVIHFFMNRKKGFLVGTPTLVPVRDDIRALRRIEENIEMLIYQNLFPLFQYIVGTVEHPASTMPDGVREVDAVKYELEIMPAEGMIVTPERHEIKAIGSEGRALRAEGYLQHFRDRLFGGLGVSAIDVGLGETANRSCYSEDTQTLTDNGWKFYWEITSDDKIATYNPDTNQLEFHIPNGDMLLHDYSGPMYHFKNRNVDTLVTPDHDMWMGRPLWKDRIVWEKIHADQIDIKAFRFLSGGLTWEGIEPEDFLLPHVPYRCYSRVSNSGPFERIDISTWLEFLGYYVSEGCLAKAKNKWAVTLSQNSVVNFAKTQKIRECLQKLPFVFHEYTNPTDHTTRFWIHCKSLYLYLQENCGDYSYVKHLPSEVLEFAPNFLRVVFEAAMLGDGTKDIREGRTSRTYYSSSEYLINQMQEIALKLGYRAHVLPGCGVQRLCISEASESFVHVQQMQVVQYTGKVYCFNVPNHLFITRRNGRVGIHGNTADSMSRNLVDDVKHYQQVFEEFFNEYILKELLLESTFEDPLTEENIVRIKFSEIDLDAKIKVQNHAIQAFSGHAITHSEMRREFGVEPLTEEEWDDTFWKLIEEPKMLIQASDEPYSAASQALARNKQTDVEPEDLDTEQGGRDREIAKTGKAPSGGTPKGKTSPAKKSSGQRAAGASITPSNQHGRKTSPEKRKSSYSGNLADAAQDNPIASLYDDLVSSTMNSIAVSTFSSDWFRQLAAATEAQMIDRLGRIMRISFRDGYRYVTGKGAIVETPDSVLIGRAAEFIKRLMRALSQQISDLTAQDQGDQLKQKVVAIFDASRYRSDFIFASERNRGFNYGIMTAIRTLGDKVLTVEIDPESCEECLSHKDEKFVIQNMTLDNLPPFHPNCTCRLKRTNRT